MSRGCKKGEVISVWREKILYCNKRDGENVGHIIRNLVLLNVEICRNSGPYVEIPDPM